MRTKSSGANPFGKKAAKTKTWDRTAFAKTGWKSTKEKGKGKGRSFDEDEDGDEDEELDLEFAQFPAPFVSRKYCLLLGYFELDR